MSWFQGLLPGNGTKPLKLASAPRLMPLQAEGLPEFVPAMVTVALLVTEPASFVAVSV